MDQEPDAAVDSTRTRPGNPDAALRSLVDRLFSTLTSRMTRNPTRWLIPNKTGRATPAQSESLLIGHGNADLQSGA